MKLYHSKNEIEQLSNEEIASLHKKYVLVIFIILLLCGGISLLSIWDYLPEIWSYLLLLFLVILWPWIMRSSQMARRLKEADN